MNLTTLDPEELCSELDKLSTARLRTIVDDLCQRVLPAMEDDDLWTYVVCLTRYNNRAFLGSLLKILAQRRLISRAPMQQWSCNMTAIDRHKTLLAMLPIADTPQDVSMLLEIFGQRGASVGHGHDIDYLIQTDTPAAYFVLLGYMRLNELNKSLLTSVCHRLMRSGTPTAFNAASLFKAFFDLTAVRGTFSLRIQPYELGRLETDYALFARKIKM